jgi:hypothetical protein
VVAAEAHEEVAALLALAQRAHVAQLLRPDWRQAWILTPSVFREFPRQQVAEPVVRHHRSQLRVRQVADAGQGLGVVPAVQVDKAALRAEVLRLFQTACSIRPLRMAADEAVVLPQPLSLVFHLLDRQPMETFWSHGTRSPRKKHGVDRQILRPVTTRAERSRPPGISYSQASRVVCWLSKRTPVNRFSVWQQDYPPAPVRQ